MLFQVYFEGNVGWYVDVSAVCPQQTGSGAPPARLAPRAAERALRKACALALGQHRRRGCRRRLLAPSGVLGSTARARRGVWRLGGATDRPLFPRAEWRRSRGAARVPGARLELRSSSGRPDTTANYYARYLPLGTSTTMLAVVSGKRSAPLCLPPGTNS